MTALASLRNLAGLLAAIGVAAAAAGLAVAMPALGIKGMVALGSLGAAVVLILATGRPKEVLLAAYVIALTYNRQYYGALGALFGFEPGKGLYWIPADLPLVALFAAGAMERILHRERPRPAAEGMATAPVLPFLFAALLSTLAAERMDLAAADTLRIVKFALLLGWLHLHMDRSLWLTLVGALAVSILLQGTLGTLQVVTRAGQSILSIFGAGGPEILPEEIDNRARGTLGHPNMLAPYLLMLGPGAFGVALFSRNRWLRLVALAVTLVAIAGVFTSKSRAPSVLLLGALGGVALAAVWLRALSPRAAIGAGIWALLLLMLALLPFAADIAERFRGDFRYSITFRAEYNHMALRVWDEHPLLGAGFGASPQRISEIWWLAAQEAQRVQHYSAIGNVRSAAVVHNVYLLILAEAGAIGLATFLALLAGVILRGARAAAHTATGTRGLCIGLTLGLLAQVPQQTIDMSLWWDPSWYTLALIAALLGAAPRIEPGLP